MFSAVLGENPLYLISSGHKFAMKYLTWYKQYSFIHNDVCNDTDDDYASQR
jgi:hypothetical protein